MGYLNFSREGGTKWHRTAVKKKRTIHNTKNGGFNMKL